MQLFRFIHGVAQAQYLPWHDTKAVWSWFWSNFYKFFGSEAKFKLRTIAGNPEIGAGCPAYSPTRYSPTNLPVPDLHFGDGNKGIIVVDRSGGMEM